MANVRDLEVPGLGKMGAQFHSPKRFVAYFSMEIALENAMPSYSGGLGVLAGDTIRAAADVRLPMVAVSLLYRKGYFRQRLAEDGTQTEDPVEWRVEDFLKEEKARVTVPTVTFRFQARSRCVGSLDPAASRPSRTSAAIASAIAR